MQFDVSAAITMSAPAPLVMAICSLAASNSSLAERRRSSVEYQPPTKESPNSASLPLRAAPSLGILWPFSMPATPASLASARQVSSGVSPPISCRSSLLQPMGLAPMRMLMSVSNALAFQRSFVVPASGADFRAGRDCRHGYVPPEAAGVGRADGIGVDDDDLGGFRRTRRLESGL